MIKPAESVFSFGNWLNLSIITNHHIRDSNHFTEIHACFVRTFEEIHIAKIWPFSPILSVINKISENVKHFGGPSPPLWIRQCGTSTKLSCLSQTAKYNLRLNPN